MWQRYFKFIKLVPGRVDTALLGMIDFSNPNIPVEKIQKLYESDFPYLELTPEGKKYLYGQDDEKLLSNPDKQQENQHSWKHYFELVKIKPGKVDTNLFGLIDFSDDKVPVEKIKKLYESGFPYLKLKHEGKKHFYGQPKSTPVQQPKPVTKQQPVCDESELPNVQEKEEPEKIIMPEGINLLVEIPGTDELRDDELKTEPMLPSPEEPDPEPATPESLDPEPQETSHAATKPKRRPYYRRKNTPRQKE